MIATRCAQILLVAAVVGGLLWILAKVGLVVIAAIVALILASAVHPLVDWLVRRRWSPLLATVAAFLATLIVLGGAVTGIVFAVRGDWEELSSSARCRSIPRPSTPRSRRPSPSSPAGRSSAVR
jgi:predicted PurR-regulated permease PerM